MKWDARGSYWTSSGTSSRNFLNLSYSQLLPRSRPHRNCFQKQCLFADGVVLIMHSCYSLILFSPHESVHGTTWGSGFMITFEQFKHTAALLVKQPELHRIYFPCSSHCIITTQNLHPRTLMAHPQIKGVATSWTRKILFQIWNIYIKLFKALSPPEPWRNSCMLVKWV